MKKSNYKCRPCQPLSHYVFVSKLYTNNGKLFSFPEIKGGEYHTLTLTILLK